jgi:hypothetical protein
MVISNLNRLSEMAELGFDKALEKFLDKFLELHPKNEWPEWFKSCTTYGGERDSDNRWRFAFTAIPKQALSTGEAWEETPNGNYALIKVDPESGEKRYVISNTTDKIIKIFEVVIDPVSMAVSVVVDENLEEIDGDELLPIRK